METKSELLKRCLQKIEINKVVLQLVLLFLISCSYRQPVVIDLEPPVVTSFFYHNKDIILQFDEPVVSYNLLFPDGKMFGVNNKFPVANNYMDETVFLDYQNTGGDNDVCNIETTDTSGNTSNTEVSIPFVCVNPPILKVAGVRLKYNKKKLQYILLKVERGGDLHGTKLVFYGTRKIREFVFPSVTVGENNRYLYVINEYKKDWASDGQIIPCKNGDFIIRTDCHFSGTFGVVGVFDYRGELVDYLSYYDSNEKTIDEYLGSSYYKVLRSFINLNLETPVFTDVKGNTVRKIIVRDADGSFHVK